MNTPNQPYTPPLISHVTVRDFDMPFMSMVVFMIKWALASIPAMIIIAIMATVITFFFGAMLATAGHH